MVSGEELQSSKESTGSRVLPGCLEPHLLGKAPSKNANRSGGSGLALVMQTGHKKQMMIAQDF
jgi:hypothetical protein